MSMIPWIWLIGGILLMLLELLVPGLVVIFLGSSAIIVAVLLWLGFVQGTLTSFTVWVVLSLLQALFLRGLLKKYFPGEKSRLYLDEDDDAYGSLVEVIETVSADHQNGRIRLGGSTWSACCLEGEIPAGNKARIAYRDNLIWYVEPIEHELLTE
ncbi:NfeD family protein [candidate division CSSED10-310 bacterium]|uniref:NfeD family protein n=1 Tax=candidate division CSSED10-310 bacterium TaxID=2855610 RepID=A0ABV6Z6B5_UNCC1